MGDVLELEIRPIGSHEVPRFVLLHLGFPPVMQLEKVYEPQRFEPAWATWWIEQGIFQASAGTSGKTFSIVIPPPNVTGVLHMGHMLEHTEIDIVVRWHRMLGDTTLWVPGTDHAGIATQIMVERQVAAEGSSREILGREEFERRVWQWKEQSGGTIKRQMVRLGASCDWSRERFTLDEGLTRAVREVFVRLYEKGLIYRGEYMVNWCPRCGTAISDLETVHEDTAGHLWHISYAVNGSDELLTVATTRPETMLGDTAVAVHLTDARYSHLIGRTVRLPLMERDIPIIADAMVDPQFGTGVVKITPAHDLNDFEAGRRHGLPLIQVIGPDARMTLEAGRFAGLERFEARGAVVEALKERGELVKVDEHRLPLGICQRCRTPIEPLLSKQWFIKMKPLAEPAIQVVADGRVQLIPEHWVKVYNEWMHNIRDWCISRQLWWGHRIPAWYCGDCGEITVAREVPVQCSRCGSAKLTQDSDVLDTWFSSGLWPFSTLGWPDKTADLATFYPTSLLITGSDILFFWVARMIVLGLECMGEVPFRQVYLHGMVRDAERQKMSKTKGNVVDPLVVTEKYGTDAVRLALMMSATPGNDIAVGEEKFKSAGAFANKIWNASRFLFMRMESAGFEPWMPQQLDCCQPIPDADSLVASLEDRWIFARLNRCAEQVNRAIEQHRFHEVAQTLYHFFWDEFCDWYIELKKTRLKDGSGLTADWQNVLTVYEMALRLLHPLMPFVTEELWQRLASSCAERPVSIAITHYPQYSLEATDAVAEREMAILQDIVTSAREVRADLKIAPSVTMDGVLIPREAARAMVVANLAALEKLTTMKLVIGDGGGVEGVRCSGAEFELVVRVSKEQADAQQARLEKELEQLVKVIASSERQLADSTFMSRAPAHVVETIQTNLAAYRAQSEKLREQR